MLVVRTLESGANALGELVGAKQALGFHHPTLAVNPFGLYGVEPRALYGQQTTYDPHSTPTPFDLAVVRCDPLSELSAYVPACVVPHQHPHFLANRFEFPRAPTKKPSGYRAHRPTIHKTQPRPFKLGHIQPVAGDGLRIRIILGDRLLMKAQDLALLAPSAHGG